MSRSRLTLEQIQRATSEKIITLNKEVHACNTAIDECNDNIADCETNIQNFYDTDDEDSIRQSRGGIWVNEGEIAKDNDEIERLEHEIEELNNKIKVMKVITGFNIADHCFSLDTYYLILKLNKNLKAERDDFCNIIADFLNYVWENIPTLRMEYEAEQKHIAEENERQRKEEHAKHLAHMRRVEEENKRLEIFRREEAARNEQLRILAEQQRKDKEIADAKAKEAERAKTESEINAIKTIKLPKLIARINTIVTDLEPQMNAWTLFGVSPKQKHQLAKQLKACLESNNLTRNDLILLADHHAAYYEDDTLQPVFVAALGCVEDMEKNKLSLKIK